MPPRRTAIHTFLITLLPLTLATSVYAKPGPTDPYEAAQEAGGYWVDLPGGLQIIPTLPGEINGGKALSIPLRLEVPLSMAVGVRTSYRMQGDVEFKNIETALSPAMTVTIPPDQLPQKS